MEKTSKNLLQNFYIHIIIRTVKKCKNFTNLKIGERIVNEKITVLVADDNSDFTMTLSSYLEKEEQIQIVGIAKDGNEAYE